MNSVSKCPVMHGANTKNKGVGISNRDWWFIKTSIPGRVGTMLSGRGIVDPPRKENGLVVIQAIIFIQVVRTHVRLDGIKSTKGVITRRSITSATIINSDVKPRANELLTITPRTPREGVSGPTASASYHQDKGTHDRHRLHVL